VTTDDYLCDDDRVIRLPTEEQRPDRLRLSRLRRSFDDNTTRRIRTLCSLRSDLISVWFLIGRRRVVFNGGSSLAVCSSPSMSSALAFVFRFRSSFLSSSLLLFLSSLPPPSLPALSLLLSSSSSIRTTPQSQTHNGHRYSRRTSQSSDALRIGETMARTKHPFWGTTRAPAHPVFFLTSRTLR
jgi:hypothetical protein